MELNFLLHSQEKSKKRLEEINNPEYIAASEDKNKKTFRTVKNKINVVNIYPFRGLTVDKTIRGGGFMDRIRNAVAKAQAEKDKTPNINKNTYLTNNVNDLYNVLLNVNKNNYLDKNSNSDISDDLYEEIIEYLKENKLITEKEGIALTDPLDVKKLHKFSGGLWGSSTEPTYANYKSLSESEDSDGKKAMLKKIYDRELAKNLEEVHYFQQVIIEYFFLNFLQNPHQNARSQQILK